MKWRNQAIPDMYVWQTAILGTDFKNSTKQQGINYLNECKAKWVRKSMDQVTRRKQNHRDGRYPRGSSSPTQHNVKKKKIQLPTPASSVILALCPGKKLPGSLSIRFWRKIPFSPMDQYDQKEDSEMMNISNRISQL